MMKRALLPVAGLLSASWLSAVALGQQARPTEERAEKAERLSRVVEKLGAAVECHQGGLFSIAYTERVVEERLQRDLKTREGKAKEYVFENVVLREPLTDGETYARDVSRLKSEGGRAAELRLESRVTGPYAFESPRAMKVGGLRFGPKRRPRYERMEPLTSFRRVGCKGPARTLLLPVFAETLRVIEGADHPRVLAAQTFTDYRRFVSGVEVIAEDGPQQHRS